MTEIRKFTVAALTRVEGEGGLEIHLRGREIERVHLRIYEPPRFFESFLKGRDVREVPDMVARICGICPVAYQMSACQALEKGLQMEIPDPVSQLRRMLYCGEWIESHALHMVMLHAPDFLGYAGGIEMAADHPQLFENGLRIRKIGNDLLTVLGGRAIHPINVTVGGFYRHPDIKSLHALLPEIEWALDTLHELLPTISQWNFQSLEMDYQFVSLKHDSEYPLNLGDVVASDGLKIPVEEYEDHFQERHMPQSTALHSVRLPQESNYLVGPLARVNLCREQLSPLAKELCDQVIPERPLKNQARSMLARGIELIFSLETAADLIRQYRRTDFPCLTPIPIQSGRGCHATEAPRGLLYHRYEIDQQGKIAGACIIPPTSQNQGQIEADLRALIPSIIDLPDEQATVECEKLIRHYDPCISCATHFIKIDWHRHDGHGT